MALVRLAEWLKRLVWLAAISLLLAACAGRDPYVSASVNAATAGNWRIERQLDRITGAPISSAFLVTRSVSNSAILFPKPAELQLMCFKQQPAVRVAFTFKVGSTKNAELGYRFDDRPGHEPPVRFVEDYKTIVIEDKAAVTQFVDELATANALYVRIRSFDAGRSSAEFHVDGAPAAIAAGFAACPFTPATRASAQTPAARITGKR